MNDIAFGQVYPVNSIIHSLDARLKILITIAFIVLMFFINSFIVYGFVALCLFIVVLLSKVPPLRVLKSISAVIVLLVFTFIITALFSKGEGAQIEMERYGFYVEAGIITICGSGLLNAAKITCRILLLVLGPTMLTLTTTPVEITNAIEFLLSPLKLIKVPVHEFAMIMSIALRLIPSMMEETQKIINAQKARGAAFDHGNIFKRAASLLPVLIPLFVSSFRRAEDLADAMDSRCYHGGKGRTRYRTFHFGFKDLIFSILFLIFYFITLNLCFNYFSLELINNIVFI